MGKMVNVSDPTIQRNLDAGMTPVEGYPVTRTLIIRCTEQGIKFVTDAFTCPHDLTSSISPRFIRSKQMTKPKILIIDDEEDQCIIIRNYFQSKQYEVFTALSLKKGFESLRKNMPDILMLDNNLPDGKGWEAIDSIVEEFPALKVHLISAYRQKDDILPMHENVTVWEKPISLNILAKAFLEQQASGR